MRLSLWTLMPSDYRLQHPALPSVLRPASSLIDDPFATRSHDPSRLAARWRADANVCSTDPDHTLRTVVDVASANWSRGDGTICSPTNISFIRSLVRVDGEVVGKIPESSSPRYGITAPPPVLPDIYPDPGSSPPRKRSRC
jgi:hypothetical protein